MTANQINYAKLQEEIRHNLATEQETERHGREDERIRSEQNELTKYYNQGMLSHYAQQDAINLQYYTSSVAETERSNKAKEALQKDKQEKDYALGLGNLEIEQGKLEVSKGQLLVSQGELEVAKQNAATNAKNAETRVKELKETKKKNERDYKVAMRNAATQEERNKINKEYYNAQIIVDQLILDETKRHNKETESTANYSAGIANYSAVVGTVPSSSVVEKNKAQTELYNTQAAQNIKETERYDEKVNSEIASNYGRAISGNWGNVQLPNNVIDPSAPYNGMTKSPIFTGVKPPSILNGAPQITGNAPLLLPGG